MFVFFILVAMLNLTDIRMIVIAVMHSHRRVLVDVDIVAMVRILSASQHSLQVL